MEKFPENQNNNSESEHPKAAEKVSFKNKLKRIFGTSAAIGATALMVGCGKGNDANAINNTPAPTDNNSPKTESNIEDAGITTSQDVDTVEFDDGTSVDISNDIIEEDSEVEVKSGEVNPDDFWEGDTFHLDEYAEALGYEVKPSGFLYLYDTSKTRLFFRPIDQNISIYDGATEKVNAAYGVGGTDKPYYDINDGDIKIEFTDAIIGKNKERLAEYIESLSWFASASDPYDFEDYLPYWHQ